MKISNILSASLSLLVISPSFACLHTYGELYLDNDLNYHLSWASATDNGLDVCDTAWGAAHIDQDGHWSLPCLDGYVYAFEADGGQAWYSNGINAFSFYQTRGCVPNTGCVYTTWQTYNYGC